MGRVARGHRAGGGRALGAIPQHLPAREAGRPDLDRLVVAETMHERRKALFMNAAAVVVLPGGCGSPDEFFEVLAWRQLGLVRHVAAEGFAEPSVLRFVEAAGDVAALGAGLGARLG